MTQMLTLFGRDISELKYADLKREKRMQKFMLKVVKQALNKEFWWRTQRNRVTAISEDKEAFLGIYEQHLEAFIRELDYYLDRRSQPIDRKKSTVKIRESNQRKVRQNALERQRMHFWSQSIEKDGLLVSWDREKFMLIAQDRGYQTEEAVIQDVGKELNLNRTQASAIINRGRFTWGQVLCLGAMFQMTPKEFCDTFLAGYFTEQQGEYRADYENVSRTELLRQAIKPVEPVMEEVEVGADGRPLDEEVWFD